MVRPAGGVFFAFFLGISGSFAEFGIVMWGNPEPVYSVADAEVGSTRPLEPFGILRAGWKGLPPMSGSSSGLALRGRCGIVICAMPGAACTRGPLSQAWASISC